MRYKLFLTIKIFILAIAINVKLGVAETSFLTLLIDIYLDNIFFHSKYNTPTTLYS